MSKKATMSMIHAEQRRLQAQKGKEEAEIQRKHEECVKAFAPIMEMWDDVKNMQVPNFKWHSGNGMIVFNSQRSNKPFGKEPPKTVLEFYDGSGNPGLKFGCEYGNGGVRFYKGRAGTTSSCSFEELLDKFLKFLAERIPAEGAGK